MAVSKDTKKVIYKENTKIVPRTTEELLIDLMTSDAYDQNKDTINSILDQPLLNGDNIRKGQINWYLTSEMAILIINVCDSEKRKRRKVVVVVFDRTTKEVVDYKRVEAQLKYDNVVRFVNNYYPLHYGAEHIIVECARTYTYSIFEMRKDKIYLRGTDKVLINLSVSDEIESMQNFITEMTAEPKVHSKELDKILGYDFFSKKKADLIAGDLGYKPNELFGMLHAKGLIYKDGVRFSKRSRSAKLKGANGEEQFFGIKKKAIDILNGGC